MPQQRFGIQLFVVLGAVVAACGSDLEPSGPASGVASAVGGAAGAGGTGTSSGVTTTGGAVTSGGVTGAAGTSTSDGISTTGSAVTTTDGAVATTDGAAATTVGGATGAGGTDTAGSDMAAGGSGTGGLPATTGTSGTSGSDDDPLGPCGGTEDECEAARIINEYRAQHINEGECNEPLQWSDKVGQLAHAHQESLGASIAHSDHGYPENVGLGFGLRDTTEYIIQFEEGTEPHCNPDGSFSAGHHCTAMLCSTRTVGIGIVSTGDQVAMTMMFGDENGDPGW